MLLKNFVEAVRETGTLKMRRYRRHILELKFYIPELIVPFNLFFSIRNILINFSKIEFAYFTVFVHEEFQNYLLHSMSGFALTLYGVRIGLLLEIIVRDRFLYETR
jgi:hypothetical protein